MANREIVENGKYYDVGIRTDNNKYYCSINEYRFFTTWNSEPKLMLIVGKVAGVLGEYVLVCELEMIIEVRFDYEDQRLKWFFFF